MIIESLYSDELAFSTYLPEALKIAHRDGFEKFGAKGWELTTRMVDKDTVLPILTMAWPRRNDEAVKKCVTKCFELIGRSSIGGMGSKWIVEFAALMDKDMQEHMDGLAAPKKRARPC